MAQFPCRSCVYFRVCGDNMRTMPCAGRVTKTQQKRLEIVDGKAAKR